MPLLSFQKGKVKVYNENGAQSPLMDMREYHAQQAQTEEAVVDGAAWAAEHGAKPKRRRRATT